MEPIQTTRKRSVLGLLEYFSSMVYTPHPLSFCRSIFSTVETFYGWSFDAVKDRGKWCWGRGEGVKSFMTAICLKSQQREIGDFFHLSSLSENFDFENIRSDKSVRALRIFRYNSAFEST